MSDFNFKLSDIVTGRVVPHSVQLKQMEEAKKSEETKKQHRHEWRLAIFNTFGGAVAGLITSIIFWLITK